MKRFLVSLLVCLAVLTLTGCAHTPAAPPPPEQTPPETAQPTLPEAETSDTASPDAPESLSPPSSTQPPAAKTEPEIDPMVALLHSMTLEEKVGQVFFVRCPAENAAEDVATYHLGGYILFGRDFQNKTANDVIQTIRAYQSAAATDTGIPLLIGVDEEGGTVVRVSSNPHLRSAKFPSPQRLLTSGGLEAAVQDAAEKDALLQALGINVNLAPVADVAETPCFIYDRTAGQNPQGTAAYVSAVTGQMAADGMGSVLKHFPGYGTNVDTHTGIAVDNRPLDTFLEDDFFPFRAGIAAGAGAILVSHNIVTCMDDTLPASLSPAVHEILRKQLAFDGCVMTDDLAMEAVAAYAKDGAVAVMALQSGNDLVLTSDYRTQIPNVLSALADGTLDESVLDQACLRVLRWKQSLGLL